MRTCNIDTVEQVSLFAESFNEMLMRDFGFSIYKKLSAIPAKKKEEKKEEKTEAVDDAAVKVTLWYLVWYHC